MRDHHMLKALMRRVCALHTYVPCNYNVQEGCKCKPTKSMCKMHMQPAGLSAVCVCERLSMLQEQATVGQLSGSSGGFPSCS